MGTWEEVAMVYTCPVCGEKVERELLMFISHTEKHIADEISRKHPEWGKDDGVCNKCIDHYRKQMKGGK